MDAIAGVTKITPEKTLGEIQSLLTKYNASKFGFAHDDFNSIIGFQMQNRQIKFVLPLPDKTGFCKDKRGYLRNAAQVESLHKQEIRSRWRGLLLSIKAKLESVEVGIETFEEAFMAHIVLPTGKTMGEWAIPQIEQSYQSGKPPKMLTFGS